MQGPATPGGRRGDSSLGTETSLRLVSPPEMPFLRGSKELSPMPAAEPRGAAGELPSTTTFLCFQRHKKPLGTQLHPYLSAVISWYGFSSKPRASSFHTPARGHHNLMSISSPGTQKKTIWQLAKRKVTCFLGWSLPFTQQGLTDPVGLSIPTRS